MNHSKKDKNSCECSCHDKHKQECDCCKSTCKCSCHEECDCCKTKHRCCGEPSSQPDFSDAPGWKPGDKSLEDPFAGAKDGKDLHKLFQDAVFTMLTSNNSNGPKMGPRKNEYLPYLVVRANAGDHGSRPVAVGWESPDIFVAPDMDANSAPAVPPTHGGLAKSGVPNTLWAHVWNLGLAPVINARVEFYWFDPSIGLDTSSAHLIGVTHVDLGDRYSGNCHTIVKCPNTWVPQYLNGGHECLVVRFFEPLMDSLGPEKWNAATNRHIGQRNISVVNASSPATLQIPLRLGCSTPPGPVTIEITTEKIQNVKWLSVLAGKYDSDLVDAKSVSETVGLMYPTLVRKYEDHQIISDLTGKVAKSLLHRSINVERGCDEYEVILNVRVDGLQKNECKIYRIHQRAGEKIVGGYTVITRKL